MPLQMEKSRQYKNNHAKTQDAEQNLEKTSISFINDDGKTVSDSQLSQNTNG